MLKVPITGDGYATFEKVALSIGYWVQLPITLKKLGSDITVRRFCAVYTRPGNDMQSFVSSSVFNPVVFNQFTDNGKSADFIARKIVDTIKTCNDDASLFALTGLRALFKRGFHETHAIFERLRALEHLLPKQCLVMFFFETDHLGLVEQVSKACDLSFYVPAPDHSDRVRYITEVVTALKRDPYTGKHVSGLSSEQVDELAHNAINCTFREINTFLVQTVLSAIKDNRVETRSFDLFKNALYEVQGRLTMSKQDVDLIERRLLAFSGLLKTNTNTESSPPSQPSGTSLGWGSGPPKKRQKNSESTK